MNAFPFLPTKYPTESNKQFRKRITTDIIFASSIPITFILKFIFDYLNKIYNGNALLGKIYNGQYWVANNSYLLSKVTQLQWIISIAFSILIILSGVLLAGAIVYFPVRYFIIPILRSKTNKNQL